MNTNTNMTQQQHQQQPQQQQKQDWFGKFLQGFVVVAGCTALVMAVYETTQKTK